MLATIVATAALAACPHPAKAPWTEMPAGCSVIKPGVTLTLPKGATEVDIWSATGRTHLRQRIDHYSSDADCPQYGFTARHGFSAAWVTCNRDVFNYGRHKVAVYWWNS